MTTAEKVEELLQRAETEGARAVIAALVGDIQGMQQYAKQLSVRFEEVAKHRDELGGKMVTYRSKVEVLSKQVEQLQRDFANERGRRQEADFALRYMAKLLRED